MCAGDRHPDVGANEDADHVVDGRCRAVVVHDEEPALGFACRVEGLGTCAWDPGRRGLPLFSRMCWTATVHAHSQASWAQVRCILYQRLGRRDGSGQRTEVALKRELRTVWRRQHEHAPTSTSLARARTHHCIQPFHSSVCSLLSTDASLTFVTEATVSAKNRSA